MKNTLIVIVILAGIIIGWKYFLQSKTMTNTSGTNPHAKIITNMGEINLELFANEAPVTVKNFITLASKGFYDDTLFHRVIPSFMIQAGDPNTRSGDPSTYGQGGPGYNIPDEFGPGLSNVTGTISMANAGPNTGGSQFFINVSDNTYLDGKHAVFGKVLSGMSVAVAISNLPRNAPDLPTQPVRIESIVISE